MEGSKGASQAEIDAELGRQAGRLGMCNDQPSYHLTGPYQISWAIVTWVCDTALRHAGNGDGGWLVGWLVGRRPDSF